MDSLWIDFINSDARDHLGRGRDEDRLDDPSWVRRFLDRWGLNRVDARRPGGAAALKTLRTQLQRLVGILVEGRSLTARHLEALNGYLGAKSVHSRIEKKGDAFRVQLASTGRGVDAVLFAVAASFAEFLVEGDPSRLNLCENPDCRWVFYDKTRSRTRRWCADNCGSLMKVRKHREKKKRGRGS